jgi:hypothetical protein
VSLYLRLATHTPYLAKKDVYNKWDPSAARSTRNFNPFETFKGNSPDASGIYPGEVSMTRIPLFIRFSTAQSHSFTSSFSLVTRILLVEMPTSKL